MGFGVGFRMGFGERMCGDAQGIAHGCSCGLFDRQLHAVLAFRFIDPHGDVLRRMAQLGDRFTQGGGHFTLPDAAGHPVFGQSRFQLSTGAFQFFALRLKAGRRQCGYSF